MAVYYKVVHKRPGGMAGANEPKYYPAPTDRRTVDLRYISKLISSRSSLHSADIYSVAEMLLTIIPELLQDGRNVKFGELGTFSLSVKAEGMDDPEKVTSRNVKEVRMNFRPSPLIKRKLQDTEFEKVK